MVTIQVDVPGSAPLQSTEKQGSQIADEDTNFNLGAGLRESRADDAQRSML